MLNETSKTLNGRALCTTTPDERPQNTQLIHQSNNGFDLSQFLFLILDKAKNPGYIFSMHPGRGLIFCNCTFGNERSMSLGANIYIIFGLNAYFVFETHYYNAHIMTFNVGFYVKTGKRWGTGP